MAKRVRYSFNKRILAPIAELNLQEVPTVYKTLTKKMELRFYILEILKKLYW